MTDVNRALELWGLAGAKTTFVAARENSVYRVDHADHSFALRFHRPGYRSDAQLAAELDWMAWLAKSGLSVPTPRASLAGPHLQHAGGYQVDVLGWLAGQTLDATLPNLSLTDQCAAFERLGRAMAHLHDASDAWPAAAALDRPAWDGDGLLGEAPLWDRFWANPGLTPSQRDLFSRFRATARDDLSDGAAALDYGLIHADLVPGNVMVDGPDIHLIDFDDGGHGYRLFELATALLKHRAHPDYAAFETALITGYRARRTLDTSALPLFLALRAATYVGWNITRGTEDSTGQRNARFIAQAEVEIRNYLGD